MLSKRLIDIRLPNKRLIDIVRTPKQEIDKYTYAKQEIDIDICQTRYNSEFLHNNIQSANTYVTPSEEEVMSTETHVEKVSFEFALEALKYRAIQLTRGFRISQVTSYSMFHIVGQCREWNEWND